MLSTRAEQLSRAAYWGIVPTAGTVSQAGGVQSLGHVDDALGVVLPPALIEDHPGDDAGELQVLGYHGGQLVLKLGLDLGQGMIIPELVWLILRA